MVDVSVEEETGVFSVVHRCVTPGLHAFSNYSSFLLQSRDRQIWGVGRHAGTDAVNERVSLNSSLRSHSPAHTPQPPLSSQPRRQLCREENSETEQKSEPHPYAAADL
ncbi:unnamed protein product [Pleuronectes platessa]|uniref:Uncharacterized protein n=1 Tax=Pleuronectes platessa TaxID=8262 RepID=A0A9N7V2G7_PLEPL|nr:unnamed protein product [Pleuronectes platessa]